MKKSKSSGFRILTASALALGALAIAPAPEANAKPAKRTPVVVEQPDGSSLTILRQGGPRSHFTMTTDGFLLMDDSALGYVYADFDASGAMVPSKIAARNPEARSKADVEFLSRISPSMIEKGMQIRMNALSRAAARNAGAETPRKGPGLSATTFPLFGSPKALVIIVEFKDIKFGRYNSAEFSYDDYAEENGVHAYWSDLLSKKGFDGFGATGSCLDYFSSNSVDTDGNPQFTPDFDLYGPVELPNNMSYYGTNDMWGNDKRAEKMVTDALAILDDTVDFSQYDTDGDGVIDNVYIFYAGYGEADGGPANSVWPHSWDLSAANETCVVDGVRADHYACSNETDFQAKRPDGIGTFVHEFSHVMGLPDLYATDYSSAYTPGEYSVLDYGPYNNDGRTPPAYSAYERYALGWMTPRDLLVGEEDYELENLFDSNDAIIIRTEKENEYYLAENRQNTGWDTYIPGHGMLIWHIDFIQSVFDSNKVNNTSTHQYVDLIEANGRKSASTASAHPFPGTSNVTEYEFTSWAKIDTGAAFSDIAEDPETGKISFHALYSNPHGSGVENIAEVATEGEPVYFNLQGMRVANPRQGDILIRRTGDSVEKVVF